MTKEKLEQARVLRDNITLLERFLERSKREGVYIGVGGGVLVLQ